jgi:hypothetical protein
MARIGVAPHIAEKLLYHQSGTISDVATVYQRYEFWLNAKRHWSAGDARSRAGHGFSKRDPSQSRPHRFSGSR